MPNLPTLTVTDEQATRLLAVFGDAAGYKTWLKQRLRDHVLGVERQRVFRESQEARDREIQQIDKELFGTETTSGV